MAIRLKRKELIELIESIEAGGGDASQFRQALEESGPSAKPSAPARAGGGTKVEREELTTGERLRIEVGDLFTDGVTEGLLAKLIEIDITYSLKDLKDMCVKNGLSPNGHKKKLAAKLVAKGVV